METWALWYPKAASTGLLFARGRLDTTRVLLVHAAPEYLTVEVSDDQGGSPLTVADLKRTAETPICRLTKDGGTIVREDIWPSEADINLPVILPGGEVGILKQWWHAVDHKEWRWQIELYNSLG